jgi:WD40 repeat protein
METRAERIGAGHRNGVAAIDVSADGTRALSCSQLDGATEDRTVRLWDVATGRELRRWPLRASSARFSADGAHMIVTRPDTPPPYGVTESIDLATGRVIWSSAGAEYDQGRFAVLQSALSPDRAREVHVVVGPGGGRRLVMHDIASGVVLWSSPTVSTGVAFLPNGRELLAADEHGAFWLWEATTGRKTRAVEIERGTRSVTVTPDGTRAIGGSPGLRVYDLATGKLARALEADWAGPMIVTHDDLLVTGEYDGAVRFRRLTESSPGAPDAATIDLSTSEDRPTSLALLDGDRELLVGTERGVILRFRRR